MVISSPTETREYLDPAETFAKIFGHFSGNSARLRVDMSDWRGNEEITVATHRLAGRILRSGVVTRRQFTAAMNRPQQAFILLRSIDRAFRTIDPHDGTHERGRLGAYRRRFRLTRSYYGHEEWGYVLPRRSYPARPQTAPDDLSGYLESLMWVDRLPDHVHLKILVEPELDFADEIRTETMSSAQIKIGCVPFIDHLDELQFTPIDRADRWYSIRLRDGGHPSPDLAWNRHWQERSRLVLANLDRSGAHIGLLPELALTDDLLAWWQRTLGSTPRPPESRLQWLLVGTGPLTTASPAEPPPNRAVLLHRDSGEEVLHQDKCEPFTLTQQHIEQWRLTGLEPGPRAEWMRDTRERHVVDAWAGRFTVLVCEDLSRVMTAGADLSKVGPTHLLIPVFAPPVIRHHWQQQSAVQFANTVGSISVVANSQAVAKLAEDEPPKPSDIGTALMMRPTGRGPSGSWSADTTIKDTSGDAAGVACFTVPRC